jgi:hypothetical protein
VIVATDVLDDDQVTVRPAGVVVAVAWPPDAAMTSVSLAGASVTETPVVAVAVTTVVFVPETPDAVAVIVVVPVSAPPVTTPEPLTPAMLALADVHVIVRVTVRPRESTTVAVSCLLAPCTTVSTAGVTVTLAIPTGRITIVAAPCTDPMPAMMLTLRLVVMVVELTVVTKPVALTVASDALPEVQVNVRPDSTLPALS